MQHFTAQLHLRITEQNRMGDRWKCVEYLEKLMSYTASDEPAHLNTENNYQCIYFLQQHKLVWDWWMAAFHQQSIMSCRYVPERKIYPCLRWCVERSCSMIEQYVVSRGTQWCGVMSLLPSPKLKKKVAIRFSPAVQYPYLHLLPQMFSFREHIDRPMWEKGRISNRFLKTRG